MRKHSLQTFKIRRTQLYLRIRITLSTIIKTHEWTQFTHHQFAGFFTLESSKISSTTYHFHCKVSHFFQLKKNSKICEFPILLILFIGSKVPMQWMNGTIRNKVFVCCIRKWFEHFCKCVLILFCFFFSFFFDGTRYYLFFSNFLFLIRIKLLHNFYVSGSKYLFWEIVNIFFLLNYYSHSYPLNYNYQSSIDIFTMHELGYVF